MAAVGVAVVGLLVFGTLVSGPTPSWSEQYAVVDDHVFGTSAWVGAALGGSANWAHSADRGCGPIDGSSSEFYRWVGRILLVRVDESDPATVLTRARSALERAGWEESELDLVGREWWGRYVDHRWESPSPDGRPALWVELGVRPSYPEGGGVGAMWVIGTGPVESCPASG